MKTLFHVNQINYRGTTVAITDYAKYNQEILGNESAIVFNEGLGYEKDEGSVQAVVDELKKQFNVLSYNSTGLQEIVDQEKPDLTYFIRAGVKESLPENTKTAVHVVFKFDQPHGDSYAYISEWLARTQSETAEFVPHIVSLPTPTKDYREAFGIKPEQIVIGRFGGYNEFNISFVKKCIEEMVAENDNYIFLFASTSPFIDHPNVKFINEIHNLQKKSNFINTCDAMLHGRQLGESFGLSIAEFLALNKPVMAWGKGFDLNHVDMLKDSGLLYNDQAELKEMLLNIKDFTNKEDWSKRVEQYNPTAVMTKFKEVFMS
jgi:hypothetical protein